MMTQRSARAPVALQLGSSPVRHQLHQNIVYIENFQFIYPVNKLFFRMKIFAKMTIRWQVPYGSTAVFVVLQYHGSTVTSTVLVP